MDYHEKHLCSVCGQRFGLHHVGSNPICPPAGKAFPMWPKVKSEAKASLLYDKRIKAFWDASPGVFTPK